MRHFKLYVSNLGKETFSKATARKPIIIIVCASNEFYDSLSTSCQPCDISCNECFGPLPTECSSCPSGSTWMANTGTCVSSCPAAAYFLDTLANACAKCNSTCQDCSGPTTTDCITCPAGLTLQPDNSCACPVSHFFEVST